MSPVLLPTRMYPSRTLDARPVFARVGGIAASTPEYIRQIRLGKPGKCPHVPMNLSQLFDNSGSVTGGNDPIGQRFAEGFLAVAKVARACRCGRELTSVYHFDTPTSGDLQPIQMSRSSLETIEKSFARPADGAGQSILLPALRAARAQADAHPGHDNVLVVHSDFLLFDDYMEELLDFPGRVHAVVLAIEPPLALNEPGNVVVSRVTHGSEPGALARAVFSALAGTREGSSIPARSEPAT